MNDQEENQEIRASDLKKYRTEIPNLYDDSDLDPFAFRLLVHYCRRGSCWESIRTTAATCKMSHQSVIKYREELAKAGWIEIERCDEGVVITVVDKWQMNFGRYATKVVATRPDSGRHATTSGRHVDTKNNQLRINQREEEEGAPVSSFQAKTKDPVQILCSASGLSAFPPKEMERIEQIHRMIAVHGEEKVEAALRKRCEQWVNTRGKNGAYYRKTNLAWVDLAQEELDSGDNGGRGMTRKVWDAMSQEERTKHIMAGLEVPTK